MKAAVQKYDYLSDKKGKPQTVVIPVPPPIYHNWIVGYKQNKTAYQKVVYDFFFWALLTMI